MADMKDGYASPGLRWGLLLEDHPSAEVTFTEGKASDFDVPERWGGDKAVCVATITGLSGDRKPVTAYKVADKVGDPDAWNLLCTKTLGRALKRAGYPDDMPSLRALVLWRQRNAEVDAIEGGHVLQALEAPKPTEDDDLSRAAVEHGDDAIEVEVVGDDGDPPDDQILAEIRTLLTARDADGQGQAQSWAREQGFRLLNPPTQALAEAAVAFLEGER